MSFSSQYCSRVYIQLAVEMRVAKRTVHAETHDHTCIRIPRQRSTKTREWFTDNYVLQRLSCAMADSGEWKCFHDITHESQRTLAEMNETLGSLRQWQKQRKDSSSSAPTSLEEAPTTPIGEQLLAGANPSTPLDCPSAPMTTFTRDRRISGGDNADACGQENLQSVLDKDAVGGEQENPLLGLWQVKVHS